MVGRKQEVIGRGFLNRSNWQSVICAPPAFTTAACLKWLDHLKTRDTNWITVARPNSLWDGRFADDWLVQISLAG